MTKLKDLDIETIFYIFDDEDSGFEGFYGTIDDVVEYLHYLAEIEGEDFVDEVIFDLNEQIRLL